MKRTSTSSAINNRKYRYSSLPVSSSYDSNELDTKAPKISLPGTTGNNSTIIINEMNIEEYKEDTDKQTTIIPEFYSILLLNLVTIIWGTQHAIIKQVVVDDISTSEFTLARFMIALLLVIRYTPPSSTHIKHTISNGSNTVAMDEYNSIWRWGIELGIWMFLGYAFQAIGLEYTTAQRSGFLLYLNVKFVPFFAYILFRRNISLPTWLSALTAVIGTYFLAYEDSASLDAINIGDAWSLAAAAASAMFILRLENANKAIANMNSSSLNACCLWTVTIASAAWCILDPKSTSPLSIDPWHVIQTHPFALLYLGGVTTALANYIQTKAQKDISAERASIIYAMDPVYGAFFSYLILGETMGMQGYFGAFLISCAAISNAVLDFGNKRNNCNNVEIEG